MIGTETAASLITDDRVGGVELAGDLAVAVREYLRVNGLLGPVIEIPGEQGRDIHLVTGLGNAPLSIAWLRENGATVYIDGAEILLSSDELRDGCARWVASGSLRLPPTVAISAAVRAVHRKRANEQTEGDACGGRLRIEAPAKAVAASRGSPTVSGVRARSAASVGVHTEQAGAGSALRHRHSRRVR